MTPIRCAGRRCMGASTRPCAADDSVHGPPKDDQIQFHRLFTRIDRIESDALLIRNEIATAYLPKPCDTRSAPIIGIDLVRVALDLTRYDRAGTDQAHVALEDIEQLRQLIQARAPEPDSEPCRARVAG